MGQLVIGNRKTLRIIDTVGDRFRCRRITQINDIRPGMFVLIEFHIQLEMTVQFILLGIVIFRCSRDSYRVTVPLVTERCVTGEEMSERHMIEQ